MYYLVSHQGNQYEMVPEHISEFEKIKWNEGESIFIDNVLMQTIPGMFQGERYWIYKIYYNKVVIDSGNIITN